MPKMQYMMHEVNYDNCFYYHIRSEGLLCDVERNLLAITRFIVTNDHVPPAKFSLTLKRLCTLVHCDFLAVYSSLIRSSSQCCYANNDH